MYGGQPQVLNLHFPQSLFQVLRTERGHEDPE